MSKITNDVLTRSDTGCLATVGVKVLILKYWGGAFVSIPPSTPPDVSPSRSCSSVSDAAIKVTIRPGFSGTVPIFNLKSRKKIRGLPGRQFVPFLAWRPGFVPIWHKLLRCCELNSCCLVSFDHSHSYSFRTDFTVLNLYCIKGALALFVLVSFSGYVC